MRKLRLRNPAFDAAYREIWHKTTELLGEGAVERALNGSQREVYYKGELIGTRTVQHDRLLCYLLRVRDPMNYAPVDELERWQRHRGLELPGASVRLTDPLLTAPATSPDAGEDGKNTPTPG